jgi:polysaccharide deacetylase family protein (PEP-CTERM system associated)
MHNAMNILTFDIEEWYIEKTYHGGRKDRYAEFDRILNQMLDLLDSLNTKATFFCVGEMANDFPEVIKRIASRGHEVACHSNKHVWLNKLTKEEVIEDTRKAVDSLEQCTGQKVISYRAPAFSVGESNPWVFEVLANCGIKRDASVFPAVRDFGGFASFTEKTPSLVTYNGITLKEFPIATIKLLGNEVAYSGGGYFRFFPLSFIRNQMKQQSYSMIYFHIGDLIVDMKRVMTREEYEEYFKEKGSFVNRYKRYVKSNLGTKGALNKLIKLIENEEFIDLEEADRRIDWGIVPKIELK